MDKVNKTDDAKKGGLLVGKSHADGGMPAIVVDTGQPIEVEGGEVIINKEASKKYWKELSKINQSAGNGVPIPPPADFSGDVSQYNRGGKISLSDLKIGTKMELEHSDTIRKYMKNGLTVEQVARSIAKDHLNENPNYYKILSKLKLAKGGKIVCRSCGWDWSVENGGNDPHICHKCGNDNAKFYAPTKAGKGLPILSLIEQDPETGLTGIEELQQFHDTPHTFREKVGFIKEHPELLILKKGGVLTLPQKEEIYADWSSLVNMTKNELKTFYDSPEGKKAGLTPQKAKALKISHGRESARWIMKMLDMPYTQWSDEMWDWAQKQINFIKRMSGNKGSLYDKDHNKTRKHTSLLIWGHNPDKFKTGGSLSVWEKNGFREYPKTSPQEWQLVEWSMNGHSPSFKGKLYFQSGTGLMYIEKSDGEIYKPKSSNKLFWREIQEYAKGGRTKKENRGGDCYETAGKIALGITKGLNSNEFMGTPYVVHAEVMGQGAISGVRYGHAWVEDDVFVYDFSNGRNIIFPKEFYYQLGKVIQKQPKYYKYTFSEARRKMLESGHYGSWDLKTESGL